MPSPGGGDFASPDRGTGGNVDPNELLAPPSASPSSAKPVESPPAKSFEVERWAREQGVVADLDVESCELASFGGAKGAAIWCERVEESATDGIATTVRSLYLARGQKLAKVADVAVATGPLDPPGSSTAERYWVKLEPQTAPDGGTVSFGDIPEASCESARTKNTEFGGYLPDQAVRHGKAIERVCTARGSYVWAGGGLRKKTSGQPR